MVGMWGDENMHRLMLSRRCGYCEAQKAVMKQHARSSDNELTGRQKILHGQAQARVAMDVLYISQLQLAHFLASLTTLPCIQKGHCIALQ